MLKNRVLTEQITFCQKNNEKKKPSKENKLICRRKVWEMENEKLCFSAMKRKMGLFSRTMNLSRKKKD